MDVNEKTFEWFKQARGKNIPVSGPIICEKAASIAERLGIEDFKASDGWLNSFRNRHNIQWLKVCGESADVDPEVATEYKLRLPDMLSTYDDNDIFNCDEKGLFFKILPDKTLCINPFAARGFLFY
jgi:hypothetical protein